MTPEYILRKSLCRTAHCADGVSIERRASYIEDMNFADGYAEPGYTDPDKAVLFANWNYFPRGIDSILESYGYAIEWSDEWAVCEGCNKAVRTSPAFYRWQPSYALVNDCEIICSDCLAKDAGDYMESLENDAHRALNIPAIDPAKYGYIKLEGDFESGFDNPETIFNRLTAQHPRLLFRVDGVGQFDLGFSVWSHPKE
jgi:hypothetical protein